MGRNADEGVCDSYGEVFGHPGLHIADGSVMPGPVGTNPSLTIAAHADRMSSRILSSWAPRRRGNRSGPAPVRKTTAPKAALTAPTTVSRSASTLAFTEEMNGFFAFDENDPVTGERRGRARGQDLMFHLTITADDVDRFLTQPAHEARAEGWIEAPGLGGRLPVTRGTFNLFVPGDSPRSRRMDYRLFFTDGEGHPLTLSGRKEVRDDSVLDIWSDGHVDAAAEATAGVCGAGVVHIRIEDFAHQLTTVRTTGPGQAQALLDFGHFFLGQLWDVYGRHLGPATVGAAVS
jgi:cholesterol oxidase